jgi:hypothetical protein
LTNALKDRLTGSAAFEHLSPVLFRPLCFRPLCNSRTMIFSHERHASEEPGNRAALPIAGIGLQSADFPALPAPRPTGKLA